MVKNKRNCDLLILFWCVIFISLRWGTVATSALCPASATRKGTEFIKLPHLYFNFEVWIFLDMS
jgi:hypothetical protein